MRRWRWRYVTPLTIATLMLKFDVRYYMSIISSKLTGIAESYGLNRFLSIVCSIYTLSLSALSVYPQIKVLFMKYNTSIPSSAPVERLFSQAAIVLTVRKNRLKDLMLEMLILLKIHLRLWNFWCFSWRNVTSWCIEKICEVDVDVWGLQNTLTIRLKYF